MIDQQVIKKEKFVVLIARINKVNKEDLQEIAKREKQSVALMVRELLNGAIKTYYEQHKKYICQSCGAPTPSNERHELILDKQSFIFGDCCYFNEKFKDMIKKSYFNCQSCGRQTPTKRRHEIPVGEEVFAFGDCCYFNDDYKKIVLQILQ